MITIFEMMYLPKKGFCLISDRYTIKFTELVNKKEIKTQNWIVNLYMVTGI